MHYSLSRVVRWNVQNVPFQTENILRNVRMFHVSCCSYWANCFGVYFFFRSKSGDWSFEKNNVGSESQSFSYSRRFSSENNQFTSIISTSRWFGRKPRIFCPWMVNFTHPYCESDNSRWEVNRAGSQKWQDDAFTKMLRLVEGSPSP